MADILIESVLYAEQVLADVNVMMHIGGQEDSLENRILNKRSLSYDSSESHMEAVLDFGSGEVKSLATNIVGLEDVACINVGMILANGITNEQSPISVVNTANGTVTVANGALFPVGAPYFVLPPVLGEGSEAPESIEARKMNIRNYTKIYSEAIKFTGTRLEQPFLTYTSVDGLRLPREFETVLVAQKKAEKHVLWFGKGENNPDGVPTTRGLRWYFDNPNNGLPYTVAKTSATVTLTAEDLELMMNDMLVKGSNSGLTFNTGTTFQMSQENLNLLKNSKFFDIVKSDIVIGRSPNYYNANGRVVRIEVNAHLLKSNEIYLLNEDMFKTYYMGNRDMKLKVMPANGDYEKIMVISEKYPTFWGLASAVRGVMTLKQAPAK